MGCFEESIYQGVSLKVTTRGSRRGSIHCWMNTAIPLPEENIFSPNNFLARFFCLLVCWSLSSRNYAKEEANEAEWSVLAPLFCITRQQPSKSPLPSAHLHAWAPERTFKQALITFWLQENGLNVQEKLQGRVIRHFIEFLIKFIMKDHETLQGES